MNVSDLKKKELKLILDEKSFEVKLLLIFQDFYEECRKIHKNL